jgi:hypothetical protein
MQANTVALPTVAVRQNTNVPPTAAVPFHAMPPHLPTNEITGDTLHTAIPPVDPYGLYCNTDLETIKSVADEAQELFAPGKSFESPQDLREQLRRFAHKKGFEITSQGNKYTQFSKKRKK